VIVFHSSRGQLADRDCVGWGCAAGDQDACVVDVDLVMPNACWCVVWNSPAYPAGVLATGLVALDGHFWCGDQCAIRPVDLDGDGGT